MNTFKIGDRVVLVRPDELDRTNGLKEGMTGTVRRAFKGTFDPDVNLALVRFDNYTKGHGGGFEGDGTPSHRNIEVSQLELAGEPVPAEAGPEPVPASLIGLRDRFELID